MPAGALTTALEAPGWYGKLSVLGDFAHRRLAPAVVRRLDDWLAGWIADSRHALGERWLDAYLSAPLLRFCWSPGVVGPTWWFGVLMPSCDSAGRYFPLLVAQPRAAPPDDSASVERLERWFDRVADAATRTLADAASVEAFEHALAATVAEGDEPASRVGEAAACRAWPSRDAAAGATRWWVGSADRVDGSVTTLAGLPDAAAITQLMLARPDED